MGIKKRKRKSWLPQSMLLENPSRSCLCNLLITLDEPGPFLSSQAKHVAATGLQIEKLSSHSPNYIFLPLKHWVNYQHKKKNEAKTTLSGEKHRWSHIEVGNVYKLSGHLIWVSSLPQVFRCTGDKIMLWGFTERLYYYVKIYIFTIIIIILFMGAGGMADVICAPVFSGGQKSCCFFGLVQIIWVSCCYYWAFVNNSTNIAEEISAL